MHGTRTCIPMLVSMTLTLNLTLKTFEMLVFLACFPNARVDETIKAAHVEHGGNVLLFILTARFQTKQEGKEAN